MKNLRNRVIAILTAFIIGFVMFSMANATTPAENQAAGEKFLSENAQKPGVTSTASGLQYQVFNEGTGVAPKATDNVTVHYKGTTIDGKEFDSSYSRGEPATFPLNRVIAGWTEGLQLMKEGAKYRLFIPANLAYGERGAGRDIGPNSALIFDVELIKVN
ncbi:MAG: FKBP-type peptidyl-prolyl cis-trans isomerase [Methylomonas sp.]|nr:FKBP-type peptidyl-prolyl cis-trans isomerase [Methylomonas sp.]